jgi:hypothetical protein
MQAQLSLFQTVFKDPNQRVARGVSKNRPFLNLVCLSPYDIRGGGVLVWGFSDGANEHTVGTQSFRPTRPDRAGAATQHGFRNQLL